VECRRHSRGGSPGRAAAATVRHRQGHTALHNRRCGGKRALAPSATPVGDGAGDGLQSPAARTSDCQWLGSHTQPTVVHLSGCNSGENDVDEAAIATDIAR